MGLGSLQSISNWPQVPCCYVFGGLLLLRDFNVAEFRYVSFGRARHIASMRYCSLASFTSPLRIIVTGNTQGSKRSSLLFVGMGKQPLSAWVRTCFPCLLLCRLVCCLLSVRGLNHGLREVYATYFDRLGVYKSELGLTRGICFVECRLELGAVAMVLCFWWCSFSAAATMRPLFNYTCAKRPF